MVVALNRVSTVTFLFDKFQYVEQSMIVTGRYFGSVLFLLDGNFPEYMV